MKSIMQLSDDSARHGAVFAKAVMEAKVMIMPRSLQKLHVNMQVSLLASMAPFRWLFAKVKVVR